MQTRWRRSSRAAVEQFINNAKHSSNGVFTPESALRWGRQSSGISCLGYSFSFCSRTTTTALPRRRLIPWVISILHAILQATVGSITIIIIGIGGNPIAFGVCMFVDLTTIAETYTVRWSLSGSWDSPRAIRLPRNTWCRRHQSEAAYNCGVASTAPPPPAYLLPKSIPSGYLVVTT